MELNASITNILMDARDAVAQAALLNIDELRSIAGFVSNSLERIITLDAALKSANATKQSVEEAIGSGDDDAECVLASKSLTRVIAKRFADPADVGVGDPITHGEKLAAAPANRAPSQPRASRELIADPLIGVVG